MTAPDVGALAPGGDTTEVSVDLPDQLTPNDTPQPENTETPNAGDQSATELLVPGASTPSTTPQDDADSLAVLNQDWDRVGESEDPDKKNLLLRALGGAGGLVKNLFVKDEEGFRLLGRIDRAGSRGILRAVDGTSTAAFDLTRWILRGGRSAGAVRLDEDDSNYWQWLADEDAQNPLAFGDERRQKWYGEGGTIVDSIVEEGVRFVAPFLATGPVAVAAGLSKLTGAARAAELAARGFAVDFVVQNPYEEGLAELAQEYGPDFVQPIADFMATEPGEGIALGRFKNGLEGVFIGEGVGLVFGLAGRGFRGMRRIATGEVTGEAATALEKAARADIERAVEIQKKGMENEAVSVIEKPDGTFTLNINDAEGVRRAAGTQPILPERTPSTPERVQELVSEMRGAADNAEQIVEDLAGGVKDTPIQLGDAEITIVPEGEALRLSQVTADIPGSVEGEKIMQQIADRADQANVEIRLDVPDVMATAPAREQRIRTPREFNLTPDNRQKLVEFYQRQGFALDKAEDAVEGSIKMTRKPREVFESPPFNNRTAATAQAASINNAARVSNLPSTGLGKGPGAQLAVLKGDINLTKVKARDTAAGLARAIDNNRVAVNYTAGAENGKITIASIAEGMSDVSIKSANDVLALADGLLAVKDPENTVANIARVFGVSVENVGQHVLATRVYLRGLGNQIDNLSRAATVNPDDMIARDQLAAALDHMFDIQDVLTGKKFKPGRGLVPELALGVAPGGRRVVTTGMSRKQFTAVTRRVLVARGGTKQIRRLLDNEIDKIHKPRVIDKSRMGKFTEYFVGNLLSGMKTQVVNLTSNLMVAFQQPAEMVWAGVITRNPALRQQGVDRLLGNVLASVDSFKIAARALRTGDNILDEAGRIDIGDVSAGAIDGWLGKVIRVPTRLLTTGDEFFKQMNYRSAVRSESLRTSQSLGLNETDRAARLFDDMEDAFDATGAGTRPDALDIARKATFTNELGKGTLGGKVQSFVNSHPLMKVVTPFVRTPVNIFRYVYDRTPGLAQASSRYQEAIAAGGERAAIARAQVQMGTAFLGVAGALAASGQITGRGPTDPELRNQWLAANNQPYSLKTPAGPVSFARGEPALAALGMMADVIEMSGSMSEEDMATTMATMAMAFSSQMVSQSFVRGITETLDAFTGEDPGGVVDYLEKFGATLVVPNFFNQLNPDNTLREARGFIDQVRRRIPGLSDDLPPIRTVFGEPVLKAPNYFNRSFNPFTIGRKPENQIFIEGRDGPVSIEEELVLLGQALSMPSTKIGAVEFRDFVNPDTGQTAADRYLEIIAEGPNKQPGFKEFLTEQLQSDTYGSFGTAGTKVNPGGQRYRFVVNQYGRYKMQARTQVEQEFPQLREALRLDALLKNATTPEHESAILKNFPDEPQR